MKRGHSGVPSFCASSSRTLASQPRALVHIRAPRVWCRCDFRCLKATPPQFRLRPATLRKEPQFSHCVNLGDRAMWIVMYVAMIASLSAMGMVPVAEYSDQLPHDDA